MVIFELLQQEKKITIGVFENLSMVMSFISKINETIPDSIQYNDEEKSYYLDGAKLPSYIEICYKNHKVPLTNLSFLPELIEIVLIEVTNLDKKVQGNEEKIVLGSSLIDGYVFENTELRCYIKKRNTLIEKIFTILKGKGFKPEINFFGSEDGSAICYTDSNNQWHFLTHLDPSFVLNTPCDNAALTNLIEELL